MALQAEITAALEGLLPQLSVARQASEVGFPFNLLPAPVNGETVDHSRFVELVRAALRHYWGGPGLTRSNLLELNVVRAAMSDEQVPANALRAVLRQAIDQQRPEAHAG